MIQRVERRAHPPGPTNFNGPTGLTWRHAYRIVFDPLRFMQQTAKSYGDISFFRLFGKRGYLLNHPDVISQVLIHQADAFEKLPRQLSVIRQIFGDGILVTERQRWRTDRQHLQRAFNTSLMERNARYTVLQTVKMLDRWQAQTEVEMTWEMTRLTAEVASVVLVGEGDPKVVDRLTDAIMFVSDEFSHEMNSIWTLPDWMPLTRKRKKQESLQFYRELFDQLIAKRKANPSANEDFLQFLIDQPTPRDVGDSFIRDQLLTILIAAYHATSMALVWTFHLLEKHPEVEAKALDELLAAEESQLERTQFQQLTYLRNVISESLRLYPAAWALFVRQSTRPVTVRGYEIAAGGWFYISPFVTHRTEEFFPNPLVFDPDRFSLGRKKEIPKNAYFPFGLGGHACIGERMATEQLVLIVATILKRYRLRNRIPGYEPELAGRLALRPRGPFWMKTESSR